MPYFLYQEWRPGRGLERSGGAAPAPWVCGGGSVTERMAGIVPQYQPRRRARAVRSPIICGRDCECPAAKSRCLESACDGACSGGGEKLLFALTILFDG